MPITEAQKSATKKYLQKFEDVKLRVPAGQRKIIADFAATNGESVNAFIIRAIRETMEREQNGDKS